MFAVWRVIWPVKGRSIRSWQYPAAVIDRLCLLSANLLLAAATCDFIVIGHA